MALIGVPPLAAVALGRVVHGARLGASRCSRSRRCSRWPGTKLQGSLAGETAAMILSALSCVTLGAMLAAVAPPSSWLKLGIVAMAAVDTVLVVSDLLQTPNAFLNAACARAGPRCRGLQDVTLLPRWVMGYGDLFVAGVLGWRAGAVAATCKLRGALRGDAARWLFNLLFLDRLRAAGDRALSPRR